MNAQYEVAAQLTAETMAEAEESATRIRDLRPRARIRIYRVRRRALLTRRVLVDDHRPGGSR